MNNYTNKEIVAAVAQTNKNIAEFVNYAEHADGNYTMAELSQFETAPSTVYNEFLGVLVNKIVVQRNYTILGGWENPYSIFYKPTSALGDTEELLAVDLLDGEDYSETSSLLSVQKPDVFNHYIYTEEKKVWKVSIAQPIIRAAFTTEGGLSALIASIIGMLRKSKELFIYDTMTEEFDEAFEITHEIEDIDDVGETEAARKAYEQIIALTNKLSLPSDDFNAQGLRTTTPKGAAVLMINPDYKASFDINVFASLFNANVVGENKIFARVVMADMADDVLGYVLDPDAFLIMDRILQTESFFDGSNLITHFYLHNWVKFGMNPFVNAVKLIVTGTGE
jgi:hypothetical protein